MNKVILTGRLCDEPNTTYSNGANGQVTISRYRLAVDRRFKREGEQTADFINCVTFGKNAEFVENYLHKGTKIAVTGRIQTGSYEKDGQKVYTTDIIVEEHEFCESKGSGQTAPQNNDGFSNIPDDGHYDELPFN